MSVAGLDAHYTPPEIAEALADLAVDGLAKQLSVIDLAAGEGALLGAVHKLVDCRLIGAVDIDPGAAALMRLRFPNWTVTCCDALNRRSFPRSKVGRSLTGWDLAVLNPPFSCRGMKTYSTRVLGQQIESTLAVAFVLVAMAVTTDRARIVALLPSGSQQSYKDAAAWELIRSVASVEVSGRYPRGTFPQATAATEMVVIEKVNGPRSMSSQATGHRRIVGTSSPVLRGWVKMHERQPDPLGIPLVHTTDLAGAAPLESLARVRSTRTITGPAVLLPRVGKPDPKKVRVISGNAPLALSDCVFAVEATSRAAADRLVKRINAHWVSFENLYVGPCAPHLTLPRLREFVGQLDW